MAMWPSVRQRTVGVIGGDLVEILAGGELLAGPESVVPSLLPGAMCRRVLWWRRFGFFPAWRRGWGSGRGRWLVFAVRGGHVHVSVVEAREGEGSLQVDEVGGGGFKLENFGVGPTARMRPLEMAMAATRAGVGLGSSGRRWAPVRMLPWKRMVSGCCAGRVTARARRTTESLMVTGGVYQE